MTIYTPSHTEKDNAKDKLVPPEVIPEYALSMESAFKDEAKDESESSPKPVRVTYFPKHRRPICFYLSFILAILIILACGITGGVVFYKHMTKRVYSGHCYATFYDPDYHKQLSEQPEALPVADQQPQTQMDFVEEDIEVSETDMYEEFHTPSFDDVMESTVFHEFQRNYTAIVDRNLKRCFVMSLNRTTIAPPAAVIDLLKKLMSGISFPKSRVRREVYVSSFETMVDLEPFGPRIVHRCRLYPTFWVERKQYPSNRFNDFVSQGSSHIEALRKFMYAMLNNEWEEPTVFKLNIQSLARWKRLAASAP